MNDHQLTAWLRETDAYAQHLPLPDGWSSDVALAEIERRMDMKTQEPNTTETVRDAAPMRRGLLAAATAVVVILLAGTLLIYWGGRRSADAPAESPTTITPAVEVPTTAVPETPTTTAVDAGESTATTIDAVLGDADTLMTRFVAAFNDRYTDFWLLLWVVPEYRHFTSGTEVTLDETFLRARIAWGAAFDEVWTLESCRMLDTRVSCRIAVRDVFTDAVGITDAYMTWGWEPSGEGDSMRMKDVRVDTAGMAAYAYEALRFQDWVDEHHPDTGRLVFIPSGGTAWNYSDEVANTVIDLLPDYLANETPSP